MRVVLPCDGKNKGQDHKSIVLFLVFIWEFVPMYYVVICRSQSIPEGSIGHDAVLFDRAGSCSGEPMGISLFEQSIHKILDI